MKILLTLAALLLFSTNVLAGGGYDRCISEEKLLRTQEIDDCKGLSYIFNPSACFATRKKLAVYKEGKCRQIGLSENVDFSARPAAPEVKAAPPTAVVREPVITNPKGAAPVQAAPEAIRAVPAGKAEPQVIRLELTCEQLKEENSRLKAEVDRLKAELEKHENVCR